MTRPNPLLGVLALALALAGPAGCGKKGPLDPPPPREEPAEKQKPAAP